MVIYEKHFLKDFFANWYQYFVYEIFPYSWGSNDYNITRFVMAWCHIDDKPWFNTLRLRWDGRHNEDNILKYIFLNENVLISIKISLTFGPRGPINNIPPFVQIMAWHWPGDKPLSGPMMVRLLTHICITRPQWVKPIMIPSSDADNFCQPWVPIHCCIFYHNSYMTEILYSL